MLLQNTNNEIHQKSSENKEMEKNILTKAKIETVIVIPPTLLPGSKMIMNIIKSRMNVIKTK